MRLDGLVIVVSGSTGIARATADAIGAAGGTVFEASLESGYDLRRADDALRAAGTCLDMHGRIDGLFNIAGASGRRHGDGPLHECTDEGWAETLRSNLDTAFHLTRAVLPSMMARRGGSIVLTGSVLATHPSPRLFATHAYAAAKGAIEALTLSLAAYYAPQGIRVNAITPGLVHTPMTQRAQQSLEIQAYAAGRQPLAQGLMSAGDVAGLALFLLSPASRMMTGQIVAADGGWSVSEP